jgi:hypothetical protein
MRDKPRKAGNQCERSSEYLTETLCFPQTVNFDDNTLQLLDSRQKVFTNAQLVKLAKALKLDTSPPTTPVQSTQ